MRLLEFSVDVEAPFDSMDYLSTLGPRAPRRINIERPRRVNVEFELMPEAGDRIGLSLQSHASDVSSSFDVMGYGTQEVRARGDALEDKVRESVEAAIADFLAGRTNPRCKPASARTAEEQSEVERELADHARKLNAENKRLVAQCKEREEVADRLLAEWQEMRNRVLELEHERATREVA